MPLYGPNATPPPWSAPTNFQGNFPSSPPTTPSGALNYNDWWNKIGQNQTRSVSFGSPGLDYLTYLGGLGGGTTQTTPTSPAPTPTPIPGGTQLPTTPSPIQNTAAQPTQIYKPLASYSAAYQSPATAFQIQQPIQSPFQLPNTQQNPFQSPQQSPFGVNQYYPLSNYYNPSPSGGTGQFQQY
jgi:hypothetical protein